MNIPVSPAGSRRTLAAQAATLVAPRQFAVQAEDLPQPKAREVRIRIQGCGVCGSSLPVWEGRDWFDYPLPPGGPGHEGWGIVDKIGCEVQQLTVGQRVACLSYQAYAAYDLADASQVLALPSSLDARPFPAEPLACAMNVLDRCGIEPGQTVAVIGVGFLGALLIQLAASAGARVTAISRRPFALEIAEKCGAIEAVLLDDSQLQSAPWADRFPRVIEATGWQQTLDLATHVIGVRGRLIVCGYHQDGPRQINMQQWNWKGIDVINAHERDPQTYVQGMRAAVDAVAEGRLALESLFTHEFSLSEINDAFRMASERPEGFLKALIRNA